MIRTFRNFGALALVACLSIATLAYQAAAAPIRRIVLAVKAWAREGVEMAARADGAGFARPQVLFVQARAFVLRLAKRERPQLSGSWRMCPST